MTTGLGQSTPKEYCFRSFRRLAPRLESGSLTIEYVTIQRMEHVGIVVDDLAAATEFFVQLGLEANDGVVTGSSR